MTGESSHEPPLQFRKYVRIVRARRWGVLAIAALVVAAALVLTFRQTPQYEGQAEVLVNPVQTPSSASVSISQEPNLDTERQLVLSASVADQVRKDLHLGISTKMLLKHLGVNVVTNTEVLVVRYDDPSPLTAARIAQGFADAYVHFRAGQTLSQFKAAETAVNEQVRGISRQLTALNREIAAAPDAKTKDQLSAQHDSLVAQMGVLQQRRLDLTSQEGVAQNNAAQVIQRATVPTSPVSPNKIRNGVLALLVGLVLGLAYALISERLDDRITSRQEVEGRLGAPVIAAVPRVSSWRRRDDAHLVMRADPKSPVSETYRTLGTNIQYMATQQPLKVIMITSALGGDGKTTTCANLAVSLAQAGKRVILVSADLRKPRLHQFFGLSNEAGVTELLSDSVSLGNVIQDPNVPNLRVVPAGKVPQDPAALLGGQRAVGFIENLRSAADFVIVDTPPVLAVADASILAPLVDGTIFVLDAERCGRSALIQARDQLVNAGANIIGEVFNDFDPGQSSYYPYYYNYYSQYYGPEQNRAWNGNGRKRRRPGRGSEPATSAVSNGRDVRSGGFFNAP